VHGVNAKNVSLAQKIFYDEIAIMNKNILEMIRDFT